MIGQPIAVAGRNPAKAAALLRIAAMLGVRSARRIETDEAETGRTFADNAAAKAVSASRIAPDALVLASDGGVEIPVLGAAWNPLFTSRFAGTTSPEEKARRLLALLDGFEGEERCAWWVEALAVARDGTVLDVWTERGPKRRIGNALPERIGPFWVDALLDPPAGAGGHWIALRSRFAEFCTRHGLLR